MFRGFYTAASGMITQQRRTEMLSNNMANVNTPGFKSDQSTLRAFPEMLLSQLNQTKTPTQKNLTIPHSSFVGGVNTGVYMQETIPNFRQGDLRETGIKTDLALLDIDLPVNNEGESGTVLYTIQGPEGNIRYTRNGNFTVDGEGYLTTASGLYVLDRNGNPIRTNTDQFVVDENGQVFAEGEFVSQLGIAYSANSHDLVKMGDGLYRMENGRLPSAFTMNNVSFRVQQGFIERSNVDPARTMTDMLTAYRAFEANQKVLQAYDRSMEKAANEVGRLN